ncbi:MAG TPA: DUF4129 domain-containing protein [Candidatus Eremiobacteraceae bacterium]|nr:DUF4129 domain-containing protein [Candidatus Eremiobacteraceae bacterium]
MIVPRSAIAAVLLCSALIGSWQFRGQANVSDQLVRYDSLVRSASSRLATVAAQLRHSPKRPVAIPEVHIPPVPSSGAPIFSPSLDDWLQSNLASIRKIKSNRVRATQLAVLASSLRQVARQPVALAAPPLEPAAQARTILAGNQYRVPGGGTAPEPQPTWWQRILNWMGRLLYEIFGRIFERAAAVPLIGRVLAVALLLGLLAAIGYAAYVLVLRVRRRPGSGAGGLGETLTPTADPESAYARGLAAANAGRYAEAIALLFQASLAYFHSAGTLEYDPARTAGEYRRLVRHRIAPASPYFETLATAFTFVAYAQGEPSARDWSAAQAAFLALRPLVVP